MTSRRYLAILALPAAVAIAACSSSTTSGTGNAAGTSSTGSSPTSSAPTSAASSSTTGTGTGSAGGTSLTAAKLAAELQASFVTVKTGHISLRVDAGSATITGEGDEKLDHGKVQALSLSETIPGAGVIRIVIVDNKIYAKLPAAVTKTTKPWILVTPTSSNPALRQIATSIASAQTSASLDAIQQFVSAASTLKEVGSANVAGTKTTHYSMVIDTTRLPSTFPNKDALANAGIRTLPLDLYVDGQGRPVRVDEKVSTGGQTLTTTVQLTRYNQPVTITAPPASQVGTS